MPKVSIVTYTQLINTFVTTTDANTKAKAVTISQIQDLETQNRKILGISGTLAITANAAAGSFIAHRLHTGLQTDPVSGFDPFAEGPSGSASAYTGRPQPRPFGRRTFVSGVGQSNDVEIVNHIYRVKSKRNFYPGDALSFLLYARRIGSNNATVSVRGVLKYAVAG